MLDSLLRAAIGAATIPVDVVADIATLGGSLTDREQPYTVEKANEIRENLSSASSGGHR